MKSFKLLFAPLLVCLIFQLPAIAQKTYTNATNNDSWHDPLNWSPQGIPTAADNVIIPQGEIINVGDTGASANANFLTVEEGAIVTKFGNLSLVMQTGGNFAPGSELNVLEGWITTINGPIIINGELNSIGMLSKGIRGNNSNQSSVEITGTMQIQSPSEPFLMNLVTLHIFPSGILTIEEGSIANVSSSRLLNQGIIQKTAGTGTFEMATPFENDGGTINIDSGSIEFTRITTFTDGAYNVNSDGFLSWDSNNAYFLNGTLTGQLDGPFIINCNSVRLSNGAENFLDFSGPAVIEWIGGSLQTQAAPGSILINKVLMNISDTGLNAQIAGGATLKNEGTINFTGSPNLPFDIASNSFLENTEQGLITVVDDVVIRGAGFVNNGIVEKISGSGVARILNLINNESGTVRITQGTVECTDGYEGIGRLTGAGALEANPFDDIESRIAPGNDGPGTLTYNNAGSFDSTTDCIYEIEINGSTPSTQYDVFAIETTNPIAEINGTFDIQLSYAPQLGDEFVVITAGTITECNLPSQVSGFFDGMEYIYDVICNTENVTLRVNEIVLGVPDNIISGALAYPNPTSENFTIRLKNISPETTTIVTNILGQVISSERFINTDTLELRLEGSSGIYFTTITDNLGNSKTIKIVKR